MAFFFFLFEHNFLHNHGEKLSFQQHLICPLQCFDLIVSKYSVVCYRVNPFPHNDTFLRVWKKSILKTLWEKVKLLVLQFGLIQNFVMWEWVKVAQIRVSVDDRVENIVEKGVNNGFQHFFLFSQCLQELSF